MLIIGIRANNTIETLAKCWQDEYRTNRECAREFMDSQYGEEFKQYILLDSGQIRDYWYSGEEECEEPEYVS